MILTDGRRRVPGGTTRWEPADPNATSRTCTRCATEKSLEEFYRQRRGRWGRQSWCKGCMGVKKKAWEVANAARKSAVNEAWRKAHPERLKAHRLKAVYGITEEEYDRLLAEQGGVCAICGEPETVDAVNQHGTTLSRLCVDHNHETGQIRGLLCRRCNLGLGHLGEDVARLRSAITYLEDR